jgi:hypothetical protein
MKRYIHFSLAGLTILALLLGGCSSVDTASAIQTGVASTLEIAAVQTSSAATVEARFTQMAAQATPTLPVETPTPLELSSPQPTQTTAGESTSGSTIPCYSASFVSDVSIPDGMLIEPDKAFVKKWLVKNTGSCPWDKGYALVYLSGDLMGGAYEFPFYQYTPAGETVEISAVFQSPKQEGTFTGYWLIRTPYGGTFGMGATNTPLSVSIQVASKITQKNFKVTNVTYNVTRDPLFGCPEKGTYYTFNATVTVNGAGHVNYIWARNPTGDDPMPSGTLDFSEAGSQEVIPWIWRLQPGSMQGERRWVALITLNPSYVEWERYYFIFKCD